MVPFVLTEPDGRHFQPTRHKKLHFSRTDVRSSHVKWIRNHSAGNVGHSGTKFKGDKLSGNPLIGWKSWPSFHEPNHKTYTETRRRKLETNNFSSVASPVCLSTGQITPINSRNVFYEKLLFLQKSLHSSVWWASSLWARHLLEATHTHTSVL